MYTTYSRISPKRVIIENKISDLIHHEIACLVFCKVRTLMNENGNLQLAFSNEYLEHFQNCMKDNKYIQAVL
jgi:hypothetical protein